MYAAMYEERVVACAYMLFVYDGCGSIGVKTEKEHRRKGLAAHMTARILDDMHSMGLKPVWDCTEDNLASERTAVRCGFTPDGEDTVYRFEI